MTAVTFTLGGLGPFEGEYHDEGNHFSDHRRLTFRTPDGFVSGMDVPTEIEINHPDGGLIRGRPDQTTIRIDGESEIQFLPR